MNKDFISVRTEEGFTEFKVEFISETFCVLSNAYGVVSVISDKHISVSVIDADEVDMFEFPKFEYQDDELFVNEETNTIYVMYVDGIAYDDTLDVKFSDVQNLMTEWA